MKVVILGSGNVAEALAKSITILQPAEKIELTQIYARGERGRELAESVGVDFTSSIADIATADIYIIAVSDSAINEVSELMTVDKNAVVVHTAGAIGLEAISPKIKNKGVLYPFQTFSKGRKIYFGIIPIFIEASNAYSETVVSNLAYSLSSNVHKADRETRTILHIAGVFACNFTNHLYSLAGAIAKTKGISFDTIKPLIAETAAKAVTVSDPSTVQTGPATRGDSKTLDRHLTILNDNFDDKYREIYKLISDSIWQTSKK